MCSFVRPRTGPPSLKLRRSMAVPCVASSVVEPALLRPLGYGGHASLRCAGEAWRAMRSLPRPPLHAPAFAKATAGHASLRCAGEAWCQGPGLNRRPKAYESSALPLSYPGGKRRKVQSRHGKSNQIFRRGKPASGWWSGETAPAPCPAPDSDERAHHVRGDFPRKAHGEIGSFPGLRRALISGKKEGTGVSRRTGFTGGCSPRFVRGREPEIRRAVRNDAPINSHAPNGCYFS
jgi:hypothetical protein